MSEESASPCPVRRRGGGKLCPEKITKLKAYMWNDVTAGDLQRLELARSTEDLRRVLRELLDVRLLGEPRASALLELYYHALRFCWDCGFKREQTSCVLSVVKETHALCAGSPLVDAAECYSRLQELLLRHSVHTRPSSTPNNRGKETETRVGVDVQPPANSGTSVLSLGGNFTIGRKNFLMLYVYPGYTGTITIPVPSVKLGGSEHEGLRPEFEEQRGSSKSPTSLDSTCPLVWGEISGRAVRCLVDTGSQVTTMPEGYFRCHFTKALGRKWGPVVKLMVANHLPILVAMVVWMNIEVCSKDVRRSSTSGWRGH
ncbi:cilia- and flagella-associated protein 119 isoform X2 [Dendrobates tinctorius]|uniref:cilia- and flagella-associated protein 119 isoform X2 n=1 Tax=Dendrobates tinctorius TaxID=92724 RepID=UPI003CCA67CE